MNLKEKLKKINTEIKDLQTFVNLKKVTEKKYLKKLLKESAKRLTEVYLKEAEKWDDTKTATFIYGNNDIKPLTLPIRKKDDKNYEVKAGKGKEYYNSSPFNPDKISTIIVDGKEFKEIEIGSYKGSSKLRLKIKAKRDDSQTVYFYFVAGGGSKDENAEIFFCYGFNKASLLSTSTNLNPKNVFALANYDEDYYQAGQNYFFKKRYKEGSICYPMDMTSNDYGTMGKDIFKEMKKFFKNQGYDIPEKVNPGAFNDRGNLCRADVIVMTTIGPDKKFEPISLKKADAVNQDVEIQDSLELANVEFKYEKGDSIRVNLKNSLNIDLSCIQFRDKGDRLSIVYNPVRGGDSQGYALTSLLEIDKSILEDFREKFLKKLQNNPKIRETLKGLEFSDIPEYIKKSSNFQKYLNNPKNIPEVSEFQNSLRILRTLLMLNIQTSSEVIQNISIIGNPLEMWSLVGIYYIEYTYKWKSPIKMDAVLNIEGQEQKFFELTGRFLAFLQDSLDGKIKPLIDSTPVSIAEYK